MRMMINERIMVKDDTNMRNPTNELIKMIDH